MTRDMIHDDTVCLLGEGALWHPGRNQLFWFDILARRLHTRGQHWQFDDIVSAAGWVDHDTLLVASQRALLRFELRTGTSDPVCALDADDAATRSNDGRADPWGGFWIGTMGLAGDPGKGGFWRFYKGEVRHLRGDITVTNAICFAPDRSVAYLADTETQTIMRQRLHPQDGWPVEDPEVHIDLTGTPHFPDGAVTDADGNLWNAQWGSGRVACHAPDGTFLRAVNVPARQTTCPAFGGPDLATMYVTSAAAGLAQRTLIDEPLSGQTFALDVGARGLPEPRVIL